MAGARSAPAGTNTSTRAGSRSTIRTLRTSTCRARCPAAGRLSGGARRTAAHTGRANSSCPWAGPTTSAGRRPRSDDRTLLAPRRLQHIQDVPHLRAGPDTRLPVDLLDPVIWGDALPLHFPDD